MVGPLFPAKLVKWSQHPVLSKPVVLRGIISAAGLPSRADLSVTEQLRQRAAMGGARERAELEDFETLFAKMLAEALSEQLRKEAAAHGVDVWTWLASQGSKGET